MPHSAQICCIDAPWKPDRTKAGLCCIEDALDLLVAALGPRLPLPFERLGLGGLEKDTVFHLNSPLERTFALISCE